MCTIYIDFNLLKMNKNLEELEMVDVRKSMSAYWNFICDELIALKKLAFVCKENVTFEKFLYKQQSLELLVLYIYNIRLPFASSLLHRIPSLTELELNVKEFTDEKVAHIIGCFPNLESLVLFLNTRRNNFNETLSVLRRMKNLQYIGLKHLFRSNPDADGDGDDENGNDEYTADIDFVSFMEASIACNQMMISLQKLNKATFEKLKKKFNELKQKRLFRCRLFVNVNEKLDFNPKGEPDIFFHEMDDFEVESNYFSE
ncbi:hypothetical protein B4U79_16979 [Dinothrombium tinctorium]|uniref:Uncharacterized protein n=1 Tax=Dinothrombium tinctorium TaxID=1965070 RepID=A0A3S3NQB8_9ACAR|nr:hypothetical protein B4U79_16979 [Dinothrombium tinctorium]